MHSQYESFKIQMNYFSNFKSKIIRNSYSTERLSLIATERKKETKKERNKRLGTKKENAFYYKLYQVIESHCYLNKAIEGEKNLMKVNNSIRLPCSE